VQICHAATTAAAAQVLAQFDGRAVRAEPVYEIGGVQHGLVFAPPADGDERHLGIDELAQRSAHTLLAGVAIAGAHGAITLLPATLAGRWD